MKIIGLIGGITPQSTVMYYNILNDLANKHLGGNHTAKVLIHSFDFGIISQLQKVGDWNKLDDMMADAAEKLVNAGAKSLVICANTMHLCVNAIQNSIKVPIIHIAKATAESIKEKGLNKVALLGTKYTMEKTFYTDILLEQDIETIIPDQVDRNSIHAIIYNELAKGIIKNESRDVYKHIIQKLIYNGAEGIVLGCTEIPLLINQEDVEVPVFDTTMIHATRAFELSV